MRAAALADRDLLGLWRKCQHLGLDQRIVEDDVGLRKQANRTHREQVRRARSGTDEVDLAHQSAASAGSGTRRTNFTATADGGRGNAPAMSSCGSRSTL